MTEYKRLTHKNWHETKFAQLNPREVLYKLWQLENQIENATLVERGYHIRKSYRNHDDQRYKIILIDEIEFDEIGYDGLTQAKAEARLEQLKKEQQQ